MPSGAHFIYIPGVLLLGIVIGWILGSRAAADAYAARLRRQTPNSQHPTPMNDKR
jgi:Tfp pilus assembly protein PilF